MDTFPNTESFNEHERTKRSVRRGVHDERLEDRRDADGGGAGGPPPDERARGEAGDASDGVPGRRGEPRVHRDEHVPAGPLASSVARVVDDWIDGLTFHGYPAYAPEERVSLVGALTLAIEHALRVRRSAERDALLKQLQDAEQEAAFLNLRVGEGQADTLRELQHAYNLISILVARAGGKVSVPKDALYKRQDSRLLMEETEDGEVTLETDFSEPA